MTQPSAEKRPERRSGGEGEEPGLWTPSLSHFFRVYLKSKPLLRECERRGRDIKLGSSGGGRLVAICRPQVQSTLLAERGTRVMTVPYISEITLGRASKQVLTRPTPSFCVLKAYGQLWVLPISGTTS
jgi:hypothetical protein